MDYKETLHLPQTDFSMRGNLSQREPLFLKLWDDCGVHDKMNEGEGTMFLLHDGPPYANGHIHNGTALNKILKDIVNRSQYMMGKRIHFVPGWDCHGLPIEWEIEKALRANGKHKDDIPVTAFRKKCREFAKKWINIQKEEFKRLGVLARWEDPYLTMNTQSEALIYKELTKFLLDGSLYRGARPVMWSVVEKTALADAEIEYHEHTSPTIYIGFPIKNTDDHDLVGAKIIIWTTTPWTIPGNRAISFGPEIDYSLYQVDAVDEGASIQVGDKILLADSLKERVCTHLKITKLNLVKNVTNLDTLICSHPLHQEGYDFDVPVLPGDFVTTEQGTGFVHIAPGHGNDDFLLGKKHHIDVPQTIDHAGQYYAHIPLFAGLAVLDEKGKEGPANQAVIDALKAAKMLFGHNKLRHSYPHSWRSKAPLIFRTTHQWFIDVKESGLQQKALEAIEKIKFYPDQGKARLTAMIENRPDWCISRQRVWGVPIAIFVHKETGEPLRDEAVIERIFQSFSEHSSDIWFDQDPYQFLDDRFDPQDYEVVMDVLDVWFESATTHAFVLEHNKDLYWPADLYLEGSDQHRGWFQHSLLESCATKGGSPFNNLITHGFVVDNKGRKMSKSVGNVIPPQQVIDQQGADILRLWVAASDYREDLRFGSDIIKHHTDMYRRIRNTMRYILGNLSGFNEIEPVDYDAMPELEKWVLHQLNELHKNVIDGYKNYNFHSVFSQIHYFCSVDLSSLYFDIRKDTFYCEAVQSLQRRSAQTILDILYHHVTLWLAPIFCFTAEEVWQARAENDGDSIHLHRFPDMPDDWQNERLAKKWSHIRKMRQVITGAIEVERQKKTIGSSLQAEVHLYIPDDYKDLLKGTDMKEIAITSNVKIYSDPMPNTAFILDDVPEVGVVIVPAQGNKCERCWIILPEVGSDLHHKDICVRCSEAISKDKLDVQVEYK